MPSISSNANEVNLVADNCAADGANFGMVAVVEPLLKLERIRTINQLAGAAALNVQVGREFERVKEFLQENLKQPAV